MGKNPAAHNKSSRPDEGTAVEATDLQKSEGFDASFHTSEWHQARLAALTVERPTWESYRSKQKLELAKQQAVLDEQEHAMKEYKKALAEDREKRLGKSRSERKVKKKHKKKHKKPSRKEKRRTPSSSSSDTSSSQLEKHRHRKKVKTEISDSSEGLPGHGGPVKLSAWLNT